MPIALYSLPLVHLESFDAPSGDTFRGRSAYGGVCARQLRRTRRTSR